ncbi:hypothetical protein [Streptomyces mirabilis]|uniref:hypothetical protein n=1 Tax=Streptomyces mirabilis TaxID=68239 RepID=UPI00367EAB74
MTDPMQGGNSPASTEGPTRARPQPEEVQLDTAVAGTISATSPRVLSPEARLQLDRALEQEGLHRGRMAQSAGRHQAEEMWANIAKGVYLRLLNQGPVDNLDAYLNRCVTNQLSTLRTVVEVLVEDTDLELLGERRGEPQYGQAVDLNHELIDAIKGVRSLGILTSREMEVYIMCQAFQMENEQIAQWLEPPTTKAAVASLRYKALKKVNKAWRAGKMAHLGFDTPPKRMFRNPEH